MAETPEYRTWKHMRNRCRNPRDAQFYLYGGRGIDVCERWDSFENFLADMGLKPTQSHSIDRINNDEGYSPNNCRWADKSTQARNRRPRGNCGVSGIYQYPNGKFKVRIGAGYRSIYVGTCPDLASAKQMRVEAENKYWAKEQK